MDALTVRVYKILYPDGGFAIEFERQDDGEGRDASTVETIAKSVRVIVDEYIGDPDDPESIFSATGSAFIDFQPRYDIACTYNHTVKRVPLTEEEKETFWKFFNKR
jgi:hypothetical protein